MKLTHEENQMLEGLEGEAVAKARKSWWRSGQFTESDRLLPVASVQIAGVSYDNLAKPASNSWPKWHPRMQSKSIDDIEPADGYRELAILGSRQNLRKPVGVDRGLHKNGIVTTVHAPQIYLFGNVPHYGSNRLAESSASC